MTPKPAAAPLEASSTTIGPMDKWTTAQLMTIIKDYRGASDELRAAKEKCRTAAKRYLAAKELFPDLILHLELDRLGKDDGAAQ